MRRWLDPWPAVTDLFSGLLVASFAGLVLFLTVQKMQSREQCCEPPKPPPVSEPDVRNEADRIKKRVLESLAVLGGTIRDCGVEDVCLDIQIQFAKDKEAVASEYRDRIRAACDGLSGALHDPEQRREILVNIEGHTDYTRPQNGDDRDRFMYNWVLSGKRASSVLYEFSQCGIVPPAYNLVALGFADSDPLPGCAGKTEDCNVKNRRTTFRLHAETRLIRKRMEQTRR